MAWPETVRKEDLNIRLFIGSGPGGQHRNKTETCVEITHIPTGIKAKATSEKSQRQNKLNAFKILCARLVPLMKAAAREGQPEKVRQVTRIRTYHEIDRRVVDERVEGKRYDCQSVLYGNGLGEVIDDVLTSRGEVFPFRT